MAYIGPAPNPGQNREVDDISSSFNGSLVDFTLQVNSQNVSPGSSNAIIVSLGGVIQNPGTDYTVATSTITFTTAPASGLSFFGLVLGQSIDTEGTADNSITSGMIIDQAVTLAKLPHGTGSNDGKFLRANNGADPSFETVSSVGGATGVDFNDDVKARFGTGNDLEIFHDATNNIFNHVTGSSTRFMHGAEKMLVMTPDSHVELYHDNSKKFHTRTDGCQVTGILKTGDDGTASALAVGASDDLQIYHDGTHSFLKNTGGNLVLQGNGTNSIVLQSVVGENAIVCNANAAIELYHDNTKHFETTSAGTTANGNATGFAHFIKNNKSGAGPSGLEISYPNGGDNNNTRHFLACVDAGPSTKCLIDSNGNLRNVNNSYAVLSDVSLKENIVDAPSQWDDIKNIKIRNFNWKASSGNETYKQIGVVAQELETVCPKLVEANYYNGVDQGTKYVKSSILYMKAIKALQEAMTKIETLETKVAALEAA